MTEAEFNALAAPVLERLAAAIEAAGVDCDCEFKGEGVLEIAFEDGAKILVNRHSAAQEIWVAARSGGFHFRPQGGSWLGTRDGVELFALVARLLSEQSGTPVVLGG